MPPRVHSPVIVLYVEDDANAASIFRIVACDLEPASRVFIFNNGALALKFLQRKPPYADAPPPDLIVLDVNLTGETKFDILRKIRQEPQLAAVPAVFFTLQLHADLQPARAL